MVTVAYWTGTEVREVTAGSLDGLPTGGVLWVDAGHRVSGHDHYWLTDDGRVGTADHHDYDRPGWPVVGCTLPDDRPVLNGVMVPDDVWGRL